MENTESKSNAQFKDTADGHGAQFEITFDNVPENIVRAIRSELDSKGTLYVDGVRMENGRLTLSLCRGSILLASVDHRYNPGRKDAKFHVIQREETETENDPKFPEFVTT